ncbi:MAG: MBL fold metallo-hydrolase [Deltaproteobacteria bacterium]|nr:MBL fold metallo-hydrolase [Deltaproteobacteria bacterium]
MIEITKNIYWVPGQNQSRFPYCAGLYLKGKDFRLLIDAGMGQTNMEPCLKAGVDLVILSHCHIDHRLNLVRSPQIPVWCHEMETVYLEDRERFLVGIGLLRAGLSYEKLFKGYQIQEFTIQRKLLDGERINLGGLSFQVLHTPGHTPGHLSFYFPEAELLFAADIALNAFGPFYGHDFSNISDFIESIRKLKAIPVQTIITGHSGPFQDHLAERFAAYEKIIYKRDRILLEHLNQPRPLPYLLGKNLFYSRYLEPAPVTQWFEQVHLEKQLKRLIEMGKIKEKDGLYCQ